MSNYSTINRFCVGDEPFVIEIFRRLWAAILSGMPGKSCPTSVSILSTVRILSGIFEILSGQCVVNFGHLEIFPSNLW